MFQPGCYECCNWSPPFDGHVEHGNSRDTRGCLREVATQHLLSSQQLPCQLAILSAIAASRRASHRLASSASTTCQSPVTRASMKAELPVHPGTAFHSSMINAITPGSVFRKGLCSYQTCAHAMFTCGKFEFKEGFKEGFQTGLSCFKWCTR